MKKNILLILLSLILLVSNLESSHAIKKYELTKEDLAFQEKSELYKLFNQGKLIYGEIREKLLEIYADKNFELIQQVSSLIDLARIIKGYDDLIPSLQDLPNLLNFLDDELFSRIQAWLKDCEDAANKIGLNKLKQYNESTRGHGSNVYWPHSKSLRQRMENNGFVYRPQNMLRLDEICCEKGCGMRLYGLSENDIPEYYHRSNCKLKVEIKYEIDPKLLILQKLSYLLCENMISNDLVKSDAFQNKKKVFLEFYWNFKRLPSFIGADYYLTMGHHPDREYIITIYCSF